MMDALLEYSTKNGECLISEITQFNKGAIHVLTSHQDKEEVQMIIDDFLEKQIGTLDVADKN